MPALEEWYQKAFRELYSDLVCSLKVHYADLADRLFSESLISDDVRDTVLSDTTGKSEAERVRILLDDIRHNNNCYKFFKSLKIIETNPAYQDVATGLQDKAHATETREAHQQPSKYFFISS